jgi:NADH-quinone oxidoreductase subunit C
MTKEMLLETLTNKYGGTISLDSESLDLPAVVIHPDKAHELIQYLKEDASMSFNFMTDVCGSHYPANDVDARFAVVYHMHNWINGLRIRIKTFLPEDKPEVDTVSDLFLSANWQERETYDFYGIIFKGHPDLRRILNMDEMVSFPMRKEFPMEDSGRTDKDDRYFGRLPQSNNV